MAVVYVELPSLLHQVFDTQKLENGKLQIEAETLSGALQVIQEDHPTLAVHLFNEQHQFREHVLCFLNEKNSRWLDDYSVPLKDGDQLLFMQAVSGG